ncbi:hypothetical protein [Jiangella sp. DSM 45060]|uniref:hypothetical protein n=1 Tax=Jiangella sp. DSM 45060 TaxID=1798224 RepID=UPI000879421C|nr:hypothetical protein [Jiangella sp. DSM 45060]SDS30051.1 hypothetical protein SAMN04515669_0785 [Jiangella sp. DSM 45060]
MDDVTRLGNSRRFWTDAEPSVPPPVRRRPVPDLTDFGTFAVRVGQRRSAWYSPALLAGLALFCAGYSMVSGSGLLPLSQPTRRVVLLAIAGVLLVAAVVVLMRNLRLGDAHLRRDHRIFVEHGIVTEAYRTWLNVSSSESPQLAWVLIDARLPDRQAARLHAAFDGWLTAVGADSDMKTRTSGWFRAGSGLVPSEELFGPAATGGFLAGPSAYGHWKVVMPKPGTEPAPLDAGGSWTYRSVRDDEPAAPVPTIGPAE